MFDFYFSGVDKVVSMCMGIDGLYNRNGWLVLRGIMLYCRVGSMPHYQWAGRLLRYG